MVNVLSSEVYVFTAKLSKVGGGKPGIYIPKELWGPLKKYMGRKVVIHIYVPKYEL